MKKLFLAAVASGFALAAPAFAEERQAVSKVSPVYPAAAKQLRISGNVKIEAEVDEQGNVATAKAISGNPLLTRSAVDAVLRWKYKPGPKETVNIVLAFTL